METHHSPLDLPAARTSADLRRTLTRVAWWSILLGLLMEVLLLVIRLDKLPNLQPAGEGLGKVTWSLLVKSRPTLYQRCAANVYQHAGRSRCGTLTTTIRIG